MLTERTGRGQPANVPLGSTTSHPTSGMQPADASPGSTTYQSTTTIGAAFVDTVVFENGVSVLT
jgi:hypothetical protein